MSVGLFAKLKVLVMTNPSGSTIRPVVGPGSFADRRTTPTRPFFPAADDFRAACRLDFHDRGGKLC